MKRPSKSYNKSTGKKRSTKNTTSKRKTMRNNNTKKTKIVRIFLEVLNMVKLYHWKTNSYAQHKATDELYEKLNDNIDKFIEVLLGKDESRIKMVEKRIDLMDADSLTDFKLKIYEFREFLVDMNIYFNGKRDSDILSIRDDILVDINQFLYLMTFH